MHARDPASMTRIWRPGAPLHHHEPISDIDVHKASACSTLRKHLKGHNDSITIAKPCDLAADRMLMFFFAGPSH